MSDPTGAATAPGGTPDPAIENLMLSAVAKNAAYRLKASFPSVVFTSGRRDKNSQARAMASNVIINRHWIQETYIPNPAISACQNWVNQNPQAVSQAAIAAGLLSVLNGLNDDQLSHISKHLSGDAFDVQPVHDDTADGIVGLLHQLTAAVGGEFLDREGGLCRWHAQFR
jgi:hypothetical protein